MCNFCSLTLIVLFGVLLASCISAPIDESDSEILGTFPAPEVRRAQIVAEPRGDFYYGRRYFVKRTRFWGYLREPGKSARSAKLVIFNESQKRNPDRLPEDGPTGSRYGFDQNYEYRIYGRYTGRTLYDPNSNQFLPEFELSHYKLVDQSPGWLFSPSDVYSPTRVTLRP